MGFIISIITLAITIYGIYLAYNALVVMPIKDNQNKEYIKQREERIIRILEKFDSIQSNIVGMKYEDVISALGEKEDTNNTTPDGLEIRYISEYRGYIDGRRTPLTINFKKDENDTWTCCDYKKVV